MNWSANCRFWIFRIRSDSPGRSQRRLAIYYDAYRTRLVEALAADFEGLAAALGRPAFDDASRAFVDATPSRVRNVRWYGSGLNTFLARTAPWSERPWLADLAQLEWALTQAFDAPDQGAVSYADLAARPPQAWSSLVLEPHPSVRLLELRSNAPALRRAADAGEPLPAAQSSSQPSPWLVWRRAWSPHYLPLSPAEGWALSAVRDGIPG